VSFRRAACPEQSEGSDEESLFFLAFFEEGFLAALEMTESGAFFNKLLHGSKIYFGICANFAGVAPSLVTGRESRLLA
jgi:hypothetical protein